MPAFLCRYALGGSRSTKNIIFPHLCLSRSFIGWVSPSIPQQAPSRMRPVCAQPAAGAIGLGPALATHAVQGRFSITTWGHRCHHFGR
jgi:hypothetical protein